MKKLERLNNSLFEKFEKNKINNLALCLGGLIYKTMSSVGGADNFDSGTDNGAVMRLPDTGQNHSGDWYAAVSTNPGTGGGSGGTTGNG